MRIRTYMDEEDRTSRMVIAGADPETKKLLKDYVTAHKVSMNEVGRLKMVLNNHRLKFMNEVQSTEKRKLAVNDLNRLNKYLHRAVI